VDDGTGKGGNLENGNLPDAFTILLDYCQHLARFLIADLTRPDVGKIYFAFNFITF
jgi:hypothetical protein